MTWWVEMCPLPFLWKHSAWHQPQILHQGSHDNSACNFYYFIEIFSAQLPITSPLQNCQPCPYNIWWEIIHFHSMSFYVCNLEYKIIFIRYLQAFGHWHLFCLWTYTLCHMWLTLYLSNDATKSNYTKQTFNSKIHDLWCIYNNMEQIKI